MGLAVVLHLAYCSIDAKVYGRATRSLHEAGLACEAWGDLMHEISSSITGPEVKILRFFSLFSMIIGSLAVAMSCVHHQTDKKVVCERPCVLNSLRISRNIILGFCRVKD